MKVKKLVMYAIVISVIVIVPSIYFSENYSASPFHNIAWNSSNLGQISSVVPSNTTFFVSNYTTNTSANGTGELSVWITAINITRGTRLWRSPQIEVVAYDPMLITSHWDAPKMWVYNGTLYAIVYDAKNMLEINSFELYMFNATDGTLVGHSMLGLGINLSNVSQTYAPSVIQSEGNFYLSFITQYVPPTGPSGAINATFHTVHYETQRNIVKEAKISNCSVPGTLRWGLGFMTVAHTSEYGVFTFTYDNSTLIENLADGAFVVRNSYSEDLGSTDGGVYCSEIQNHTVSLFSIDLSNGNSSCLFSFTDHDIGQSSNSEYLMYPISGNRFAFIVQGDLIGLNTGQYPYVTFICYSANGTMIWNVSVSADQYGTYTQLINVGRNEVMLSTHTGGYVNGSTYRAEFVVKNYQTGNTLWSNSYGYTLSGKWGPLGIFKHSAYYGILNVEDGYAVFGFGNDISCSYLYKL